MFLLLEPDEAFIVDTGEIVEVHAVELGETLLWFTCVHPKARRTSTIPETELTFLTNKYDWRKTAGSDRRSQLARAHRSTHAIR